MRFFIWIRCNPLKSPDSTKGIQGNASFFAWISLDLLAFTSLARNGLARPLADREQAFKDVPQDINKIFISPKFQLPVHFGHPASPKTIAKFSLVMLSSSRIVTARDWRYLPPGAAKTLPSIL
jgi:hypothetical protein